MLRALLVVLTCGWPAACDTCVPLYAGPDAGLIDGPRDVDGASANAFEAIDREGHHEAPLVDAPGTDGMPEGMPDAAPPDRAGPERAMLDCSWDEECPPGSFCLYKAVVCIARGDRHVKSGPGRCTPYPCGQESCVDRDCSDTSQCGPRETCGAPVAFPGKCGYSLRCGAAPFCSADCRLVWPPYSLCNVCLCPSC